MSGRLLWYCSVRPQRKQAYLLSEPLLALRAHGWRITGRSSAWLERMVWDHEVAGSNPVAPIFSPLGREIEQSA
jgi:hypothetical protein